MYFQNAFIHFIRVNHSFSREYGINIFILLLNKLQIQINKYKYKPSVATPLASRIFSEEPEALPPTLETEQIGN